MRTYLSAITVEFGQHHRDLDSIANVTEQFKAIKLPYNKALIGCSEFIEYQGSVYDLLSSALGRCLAQADIAATDFGQLYIVSANLAHLLDDRDLVARLLQQHGLQNAVPMLISGLECTGLLSALQTASSQLKVQGGGHALVLSFDIESSDLTRVKPFGVVSDAATCTVVSTNVGLFEWVGAINKVAIAGMLGIDDFNSRQQLAVNVTQDVLEHAKIHLSDLKHVFSTNFYKPITDFNAMTLGIDKSLIYSATMDSYGHCVCGDALLNLEHYCKRRSVISGECFMLQAYAPGFMSSAVIMAA